MRYNRIMTLKKKIKKIPSAPGVYLMKDCRSRVLYVGKAKNLKHRVQSYFQSPVGLPLRVGAMMDQVKKVDYLKTDSEIDALLLEAKLIRDIQPKYNVDLRDDKTFPLLALTREDFPRVFITRDRGKKNLTYYGPFIQAGDLKSALKVLQRIFKFRTCRLKLSVSAVGQVNSAGKPCLLAHINQCVAPCINKISQEEYAEVIRSLGEFLTGRKKVLLKRLEREMGRLSRRREFEKAVFIRDQFKAVRAIDRTGKLGRFYEGSLADLSPTEKLKDLRKLLRLNRSPRKIEGVDIADLKGREAVGSLVTFVDAEPFKAGYRRYRIKYTPSGQPDDYQRLAEVVQRRFQSGDADFFPDVLLIDGGRGHLNVAAGVFRSLKLKSPCLVALAKGKLKGKRTKSVADTLYLSGPGRPSRSFVNSSGFKLLQYVRDEAHRFAQKYHHLLRKKGMYA